MTDPLTKEAKPRRTLLGILRTYFITGLVVTGPIGITILLISWIISLLDGWFKPLIPNRYEQYLPSDIPGVGLIVALVVILVVGGLTANFLGRALVRYSDKLITQMPGVGVVYNALRQIFKAAVRNSERSFSQVVLFEYPRKGIWAIGFVTNEIEGQIGDAVGGETVSIFLPTTPNPTSGFLLFLPRSELIVLNMTVEEGARLIISAGMSSEEPPDPS